MEDEKQREAQIAGLVSEGHIIFWPDKPTNSTPRGILERFLATGVTEPRYLIYSKNVQGTNWRLYAVIDQERFYAGIKHQMQVLLGVIAGVAMLLIIMTISALRPIIRTLLQEQYLFDLANHDGLTGLYNHVYMEELLERELTRARRYKRPLSILMFDIDHFKRVNDTYGHTVGDEVLRKLAQVVQQSARKQDIPVRYGGEEFMLILTETGKEAAAIVAERLRIEVATMSIKTQAGEISITISIGVVGYDASAGEITSSLMIQTVDKALYASKDNGRNRVTVFDLPV